jgi:hypothetical protein
MQQWCFGEPQDLLVTGGEEGINGQVGRFRTSPMPQPPIRRPSDFGFRAGLAFGLAEAFRSSNTVILSAQSRQCWL